MSTMTERTNGAQEQADAYRETLAEIWERIDNSTTERGDAWDEDEARAELEDLPLEIVWEKGEAFAVVLGTGGPHTEIVGGGREGGYYIKSYWGGQTGAASGAAVTRTGEYFREMMEELG